MNAIEIEQAGDAGHKDRGAQIEKGDSRERLLDGTTIPAPCG
jgi:hypothetical protein